MKKILLKNAKIYTATGKNIDNGYIVAEDKLIADVGDMKRCPKTEFDEVFDIAGQTVYPGFIDTHTHLGMWEDALGFEGADGNEIVEPISPQLRAIDGLNPIDRCFNEAVCAGITTVVTGSGSANAIGGTLTCIHTVGECVDDMLLKEPAAMKFALGENPKTCYHGKDKTPETRMATAALIRGALFSAKNYIKDKKKAKFSLQNEALSGVIDGSIPAHIHCHRADDIFTAIRISKEFAITPTLVHATEGYMIADSLAKQNISLIIGPLLTDRSKPELKNLTPKAAGILEKAGVRFAICTDHPVIPIQYLPIVAGLCVREGLSRDLALRAITCNAADIIGMGDIIGSIKPGMLCDLAVYNGDPLSLEGICTMTFINATRCRI